MHFSFFSYKISAIVMYHMNLFRKLHLFNIRVYLSIYSFYCLSQGSDSYSSAEGSYLKYYIIYIVDKARKRRLSFYCFFHKRLSLFLKNKNIKKFLNFFVKIAKKCLTFSKLSAIIYKRCRCDGEVR